jgi:hypothetical protein
MIEKKCYLELVEQDKWDKAKQDIQREQCVPSVENSSNIPASLIKFSKSIPSGLCLVPGLPYLIAIFGSLVPLLFLW